MKSKLSNYIILLAIAVEVAVFAALSPQFVAFDNVVNIGLSIAIIGILAVGMTAVILTGGIDLSVGSMAALAGVLSALAVQRTGFVPLGVAAALLAGVAGGALAGASVAWFRVPPFIVTLALLTIGRGLVFIITGGRSVSDLPQSFGWLGQGRLWGLPVPIILMLAVFAAGWFMLTQTVLGRHIYAVGGNRDAAFLAGVNVKFVTFWVYLLNGLLVGLAGATLAARLGAGVPSAGVQYELDVIAAVVVGGASLNGGRGSVIATLWGAIFIGVLNNGLNLAGIDSYIQKITLGVVILLAVLADQIYKPAN
jgi:ribose/xylose/arabinose/galactoside ABC-type transport system permease subunit